MKDKPPFILYNNINKSFSPRAFSSKKSKAISILSRIPEDILESNRELRKMVYKEKIPTYDIINFDKKPNEIKISNNMSDQTQKNLENINSFREDFYEFNKEEKKLLENFAKVKKENDIFGNQYHQLQRIKYRFKSGTYLDHEYLIPIASRYFSRGIKVPKIYTGKSVFSGNPLILSGSELEDFIVYNLGDRKKGTKFLKRLEEIVEKKEKGSFILPSEMKSKTEKPEDIKGYVPPEILIPQLQNEIQMSKNTLKNIDDLEHFFQNKKNKFDIFEESENGKSKILIKKNLPAIRKFKEKNILNISNNGTNLSLLDNLSPISLKNLSMNNRSNSIENSALTNDKSSLFIFSKLPPSPKIKNRFSVINELYSEKNKRKSNLPSINILLKNLKGRFSNINIHNKIRGSLQNKSVETKKALNSRNLSYIEILSKNDKIEEKTSIDESEKSEIELINKLNFRPKNELRRNKILKLDLSENNNDISNYNDIRKVKKKKLRKMKFRKTNNDPNLILTEKMFNLVLKDKKLNYNKVQIIKFLEKKGYDTSKKLDGKELFKNMDKVEKGMQKSVLQEEFKIRGKLVDNKYKKLLEKDNTLSRQIEENTFKYKKIICEKNIDKFDE